MAVIIRSKSGLVMTCEEKRIKILHFESEMGGKRSRSHYVPRQQNNERVGLEM